MSNSKTSKGFANVSIKVCKYIIMAVIIIVCATVAYNFGTKIFYSAGVEAKPGTDMTVTIKKGTTIKELANTLDTTVFRVQAYVYNTKSIKAGQYTFNTSQNAEEVFNKIKEGPEKTKSTKSTKTKAKSKSSK